MTNNQQPLQPAYPYASSGPSGNNTPYPNSYQDLNNGMAGMSLQQTPPTEQIALVGQSPLIQDLDRLIIPSNLPANLTATPSPNSQCPPVFKKCTLNAVPFSNALLKKSKLPLALILEPYLSDKWNKAEVPLIEDTIVSRCTRCKTYINPFVQFTQGAFKWLCNMCGLENDAPSEFDWDVVKQQQADRWQRAELNYGCVDFIAPAEYMMRPPQPPVYIFVLDTSFQAIQSGMINVAVDGIMNSLDSIPNEDGRTKVAFITADSAVAFYKLVGDEPEILVVGDLTDIYLPRAASDLVVNLTESRPLVDDLLTRMKTMYSQSVSPANCLGSALQAARKLLAPTGGKIVCFQVTLPTVGDGALKNTPSDQKSVMDSALLTPTSTYYKTFAAECTKSQVCADMFIFGSQFSDVATLNVIPRFTGGQTHYFPNFTADNQVDCEKLQQEVLALLSEKVGLEAVMRTRCSPGLICKSFYGNCTTRVPDIMALPNVPRDQSYCVEIGLEEDIQSNVVYFQTALLYTTCFGERRIRVFNLCLPVAKTMSEVFSGADQFAIARTLCHQGIDKAATSKLRDGRELLWKSTADICAAYGKEVAGSSSASNQLTMCRELCLLPLLMLSLLKTDTFNDSPTIPVDTRTQITLLLRTLPMNAWMNLVHSNFYALHSMPPQAGIVDSQTQNCTMPTRMNLTSEKLEPHGCYLIENGQRIFIWVGKAAVPPLCMDLLNVPNINEVKSGQVTELPKLKSSISQRVSAIIQHLRTHRNSTYYPTISIVREDGDPALRSWFLSLLIEDRHPTGPTSAGANQQQASSGMSYFQWLGFLRSKAQ
ncbi:Sec23/Sec24 trunk domain-domain-containing protein [Absidia repens]|uniref:Sec23/Sec24 trunk domain-domain-containing protein n=1 Tax=Absidia repens TaxID=90262 RepID=A0A1X2I7U6_9FUNG|nr:Sec23/Sec24 trunk domain-domain-containing protein [Absidia repens]